MNGNWLIDENKQLHSMIWRKYELLLGYLCMREDHVAYTQVEEPSIRQDWSANKVKIP